MPKPRLQAETLLSTKAKFSCECTQHWNTTQAELIHSLKSELNDSKTCYEDLGLEMRCSNSLALYKISGYGHGCTS